jgi:hypothetical protein
MSGVVNTNQQYDASVDKMLDPRLELLTETDDEPGSDDEETSDWTVGPTPVKLEEYDNMMISSSDPDAQYSQSTTSHMIVSAAY